MRTDFTSALYLGLHHPSAALAPWHALTLGKPAALAPPPAEPALASALARLMHCEAACLAPSTLHVFWDLFATPAAALSTLPVFSDALAMPALAPSPLPAAAPLALLVDAAAYPVARWCGQMTAARGMPATCFGHGAAAQAERLARLWRRSGHRPLILADGYTPGDRAPPPLADYAAIAQRHGGCLLLDDTQALGVLGPGGGGSVALHRLRGAPVLVGASLAKGFGAPLAVLAGDAAPIAAHVLHSLTRLHCSPPSAAVLAAAAAALRLNRSAGDRLRVALRQRIGWLRDGLAARGVASRGGEFPVRQIALPPGCDGGRLQAALAKAGVDVLLQRARDAPVLTLLLRADHSREEIARAAALIAQLMEVQHVRDA